MMYLCNNKQKESMMKKLSMNDVSKLGRLGLRALLYFMFTTVFAVAMQRMSQNDA